MSADETRRATKQGNPIVVNGYLVYGHGRETAGGAFEAWYWISQPYEHGGEFWETDGPYRCRADTTFPTETEASAAAITVGREVAKNQVPGKFA